MNEETFLEKLKEVIVVLLWVTTIVCIMLILVYFIFVYWLHFGILPMTIAGVIFGFIEGISFQKWFEDIF